MPKIELTFFLEGSEEEIQEDGICSGLNGRVKLTCEGEMKSYWLIKLQKADKHGSA